MLAERWLGIGSVALALGATAFALRPHHHHRHHLQRTSALEQQTLHCFGKATVTPPPPMADRDDGYASVIRATDASKCLTESARVDLILTIGRDGRFVSASHRPEKETAESRCIEKALRGTMFPIDQAAAVSLRYSFTK